MFSIMMASTEFQKKMDMNNFKTTPGRSMAFILNFLTKLRRLL